MAKKTAHNSGVAEGRDIHADKRKRLTKTQPEQLSMFQTFLPQEDKYSNTIELYDAIPKYFNSKRQLPKLREGPDGREVYLPTIERQFEHKKIMYDLKIRPARVEDEGGNEIEYYPSEQEELIEEALRKIACSDLNGVFLDGEAGVQFTMYELRKELEKQGHAMSDVQLKRSLFIGREAGLYLVKKDGDGEAVMSSSIFPTVIISNRTAWKNDPRNTFCYVQFNPLVTMSIKELSYRQLDYKTLMSYRYQLSRYLHRRLYHNYKQADILGQPYNIKYSTIKRDSAMLNNDRITQDIKYLNRSLDELKEKKVIMSYEKEVRRGQRNKIEDVDYHLRPSFDFTSEMKKANKRAGDQSPLSQKRPLR